MEPNQIKFSDFIALYNLLVFNLMKKHKQFTISFYYLSNEFNIQIEDSNTEEIILNYRFPCTQQEYDYLITLLGNRFIEGHEITLPFFNDIERKDTLIYYNSKESLQKPLNYDLAKVHVIRNNILELKIYYFDGLNTIGYMMQDKALEKLKSKIKVLKK